MGTALYLRTPDGSVQKYAVGTPWRNDHKLTSWFNPTGWAGSPGMHFDFAGWQVVLAGSTPETYEDAYLGPHTFTEK